MGDAAPSNFAVASQENIISEVSDNMDANDKDTHNKPKSGASYKVGMFEIIIKRTFLCKAPKLMSSESVIQSTTEATNELSNFHFSYLRGPNPRRQLAADV